MPTPTVQVSLRLSITDHAQLQALCTSWGTGPTRAIIRLVAEALAREEMQLGVEPSAWIAQELRKAKEGAPR